MARGGAVAIGAKGSRTGPALVTGGAGFIGSHLVGTLAGAARPTAVIDDLSRGRRERLPDGVSLFEIDVREGDAVREVVECVRPATIFHLAAQIDVRHAVENPADDASANVLGTLSVLEAARLTGARVVFASSGGAAYGERPGVPIPTPEHEPAEPLSPYGLSKVCAEQYCLLYSRLHGLPTVVLRLGNVYGPGQDPLGEAGVVAIFSGCAVHRRAPVVFGDGLQTRDYVYVGDVVDAFLAAEGGPAGLIANIGTGVETSVLDLLKEIAGLPPARFAPAREGEVGRSALCIELAERSLGWTPRTTLADGLRATLAAARAEDDDPAAANS